MIGKPVTDALRHRIMRLFAPYAPVSKQTAGIARTLGLSQRTVRRVLITEGLVKK